MRGKGMATPDVEIIGITGGIGSGKSVVSRVLRLNGFHVYDCDMEARRLMERDVRLKRALCEILGDEIYADGINLDRKRMASIIFSDKQILSQVNSLVHSAVKQDFLWYASRNATGTVFCESAILASSGLDAVCDRVWIVDAPENMRIDRVKRRNGMDISEIKRRMDAQSEEYSSMPFAEVLTNDGVHPLLPEILRKIDALCDAVTSYSLTLADA